VKVFRRLFIETDVFGVQSVNTVGRCTTSYRLAGPACFVMPCLLKEPDPELDFSVLFRFGELELRVLKENVFEKNF